MKTFIFLVIVFSFIIMIGFLFKLIMKRKKENMPDRNLSKWSVKYIDQLTWGVIIFGISGIVILLIDYFK